MPLRFSDLQALQSPGTQYHEALQQNYDPNAIQQRKFQARENELARQSDEQALMSKLGADAEIKRMGLEADASKNQLEARRKFMERVSEAQRRGDMEAMRALSIEAPQYDLSIDERGDIGELGSTPSHLSEPGQLDTGIKGYGDDLSVGAPKGELQVDPALLNAKVKKPPQFMMSMDGTNMPLDVYGARGRNQDTNRKVYGEAVKSSRPQDRAATEQAFRAAVASGMPLEEAMKLAPLESAHERLTRETSERNANAALGERRAEFGMSMEQRGAEHEDKMGMQGQMLELQKGNAGLRDKANESRMAKTWNDAARNTAKDLHVMQHRDTTEKSVYALRMLKDDPLVPGAAPDKTQIIAIGNVAQLAQPGDTKLSNADRDALTNSFGIIKNISNKLSMAKDATLSDGEIDSLENALAKVAKITDEQQKVAFEEMAIARMGLPSEAVDQYNRYINFLFGKRRDFDDLAERYDVPKYKAEATPIPSGEPVAPVVDEAALSKELEEAGF